MVDSQWPACTETTSCLCVRLEELEQLLFLMCTESPNLPLMSPSALTRAFRSVYNSPTFLTYSLPTETATSAASSHVPAPALLHLIVVLTPQAYYKLRRPRPVLHHVCQSPPTVPCLPARIRSRRDCLRLHQEKPSAIISIIY